MLHTSGTPGPARPRPLEPRLATSVGSVTNRARRPHPARTTRRATHPRSPAIASGAAPSRPLTPARGGAPFRHVTGSDLAAPRHGGFGPGSGALGSRRCRGDGGSRSRSWSSRWSGGGGRGSGSRSAACTPCTPPPPSACGTALRSQDGRRVRGPGLRGQRPDHRGSFRGSGSGRDGSQPPAALREAAYPGARPGRRREVGADVKVTGRDLEEDGGRESMATDLGMGRCRQV